MALATGAGCAAFGPKTTLTIGFADAVDLQVGTPVVLTGVRVGDAVASGYEPHQPHSQITQPLGEPLDDTIGRGLAGVVFVAALRVVRRMPVVRLPGFPGHVVSLLRRHVTVPM